MRSLDGFDSINSKNFIYENPSQALIYILGVSGFLRFHGMYTCDDCVCVTTPREFPASRSCRLVTEVAPASVLHVENRT